MKLCVFELMMDNIAELEFGSSPLEKFVLCVHDEVCHLSRRVHELETFKRSVDAFYSLVRTPAALHEH